MAVVDVTPETIRAKSPLLKARYSDHTSDEFADLITESAALVATITGRILGPVAVGEPVPDGLESIAQRAVAMKAEQVDTAVMEEHAETAATGQRLRSISAGPWSESYFAPGELVVKGGRVMVDPNERLSELLWALMTDEMRDDLLAEATGQVAPADGLIEFDYRQSPRGPRSW